MIILVVGMHRSGTSLVARGLHMMGANLGENVDRKPETGNPHGHWEHAEVWQSQERLLAQFGRTWHRTAGPLPPDWILWPETQSCIDRFSKIAIAEIAAKGHWVVKDPRSSLLIPLWKAVAAAGQTPLRIVRLLRGRGDVMQSLASRNQMPGPLAEAIWEEHQRAIERDAGDLPMLTVRHADLMRDPVLTFGRIGDFCGLAEGQHRAVDAAALVDPALWHHRNEGQQEQPAGPGKPPPTDRGLVLVVMRTRWRHHLLARALRSVLSQTYTNWALQLVNDGGPPHLVEAEVAPYRHLFRDRIEINHNTRQCGMEAASNLAIARKDSAFVVIHDDDDSWSPDFLTRMTELLHETGANAAVCKSRILHETWDGSGYVTVREDDPMPALDLIGPEDLETSNQFPPISFLFRRELFDQIGAFHEGLPALGDWHFNRRAAELGPIPVHPEELAFWHHRSAGDLAPNSLAGSDHFRFRNWVRSWPSAGSPPAFFGQMRAVRRLVDDGVLAGLEPVILSGKSQPSLRPGLYLVEFSPPQLPDGAGGIALLRSHCQSAGPTDDVVPFDLDQGRVSILINAPTGIDGLDVLPADGGAEIPRPDFTVTRLTDCIDHLEQFKRQTRLPDLLCIGAQRGGTTWLHAALQRFSDVWPSPIKEFHQFDQTESAGFFRQHQALSVLQTDYVREADAEVRSGRVRMLLRHAFPPVQSWENYAATLEGAPEEKIVCDFTPAYATLDDRAVAEIHRVMPKVKVIFILRDPVDRAISGALHELQMQGITQPTEPQVAACCVSADNLARTDYLQTLRTWAKHIPPEQMLVLFHDEIVNEPAEVIGKVRNFLGLAAMEVTPALLAGLAQNDHPGMTPPDLAGIREQLSHRWRGQTAELATRFEGHPRLWLERIEARHCLRPASWTGIGSEAAGKPSQSLAVALHLFHEHQWPEFERTLSGVPQPFSLFVTLAPESNFGPRIKARFPTAVIRNLPNVGRDVAPFLALLEELKHFDLVCKLHSKRSDGRHDAWRRLSLEGLLGNSETVAAYLSAFASAPDLVLAGPRRFYLDGPMHEMQCHSALHLLHGPAPETWGFFAGTMFWCRPRFFAGLGELYPQEIFVPHQDGDGQPEHVVERAFGLLAAQHGKQVMLWDRRAAIAPAQELIGAMDWETVYQDLAPVDLAQEEPEPGTALIALQKGQDGRGSDRWRGNLGTYDRLLADLRNQPVRMLEVGVAQGGSLEHWSKYFQNGRIFVGCDIDPGCARLTFDDPRIVVLVCDAASPILVLKIAQRCSALDLVIDDGSRRSRDIIRGFSVLFPLLADDGLYIVEDLHPSYLEEHEGGLDATLSSLAFFRTLTDLFNHEHWRNGTGVAERLAAFAGRFGVAFPESLLRSIRSIEFSDQMICIRKGPQPPARLGAQKVNSSIDVVEEGLFQSPAN
ncbi:MAG: sulfotransferase [Tabrizicola sp.]|nr:sulfotransferase [Tabrizicola sp.]